MALFVTTGWVVVEVRSRSLVLGCHESYSQSSTDHRSAFCPRPLQFFYVFLRSFQSSPILSTSKAMKLWFQMRMIGMPMLLMSC